MCVRSLVAFAGVIAALVYAEGGAPAPQIELLAVVEHKGPLARVGYSPDGKTIATGTATTSSIPERTYLRLLDAATYKDRTAPRTYWADVRAIAFSSDSKLVAVVASKHDILDGLTGKLICRLDPCRPIGFVKGNKALAALAGGPGIELVDARTGKRVETVAGAAEYERSTASPDGKAIAVVTKEHELQLVNTDTWEARTVRRLQWDPMLLLWSGDSKRLFVNGDPGRDGGRASVYDVAADRTTELETTWESGGAFSPDGTSIVLCGHTMRTSKLDGQVYDTRTGKLQCQWDLHGGKATCIALSPDGRFMVTGGADNRLKVWRFRPAPHR